MHGCRWRTGQRAPRRATHRVAAPATRPRSRGSAAAAAGARRTRPPRVVMRRRVMPTGRLRCRPHPPPPHPHPHPHPRPPSAATWPSRPRRPTPRRPCRRREVRCVVVLLLMYFTRVRLMFSPLNASLFSCCAEHKPPPEEDNPFASDNPFERS